MRIYSSTISAMELNGSITSSDTTITLNTGSVPAVSTGNTLTLVIRPDTEFEEIVYVTAHSATSTSYTVQRGREGTTAQNHPDKAVVRHMITGSDLQEPHYHINASQYSENNSTSLHGLGSADGKVVGTTATQTLKNKTINVGAPDNNSINGLTVSNVSGIAGTYAPLASPALTGSPTVNGVAIATTATAPASHTHGNITNDGKIGASSGLVVVTGASGTLTTLAAGTTSQYLRGDGTWQAVTGGGVTSVSGTTNQITVSPTTGAAIVSLSSTLVLPSGTTATTQVSTDDSTKVATTAFVQDVFAGVSGGSSIARYVRSADTASIQATATSSFAASNSLTANTLYKFSYVLFVNFTYSGISASINLNHAFTQTPQEITWMFNNANDLLTGHSTVTSAVSVSNTMSGNAGKYIEVEGYFKTNATTGGTFNPQINLTYSGSTSGSIVVKKGSSIELFSISSAGSWI